MSTQTGITLRPPTSSDAPVLAAAVNESLAELRLWMPWAASEYDESAALAWIAGDFGAEHTFVMIDPEGTLVGSCGLNQLDGLNKSANLGYWVHSAHVGRGYATQATCQLAMLGHNQFDLHRIEIAMSVRNEGSRRVAEKAGAVYEGVSRGALYLLSEFHDAHVFSLVAQGEAVPL